MLKTFRDTKKDPANVIYRMGSLTFESDQILIPLQAADLAAYEIWKWLDEHFANKTRHGRFPLQEIVKIPWKIREFDKGILEELLDKQRGKKVSKRVIHNFIAALRPGVVEPPQK